MVEPLEGGCKGCPNNEPFNSKYTRCMLSRMIMPAGWHCYIVVEDGERKRCFAQVYGPLKCTDEWRG
jgi:hypothetical protein